MAHQTKIMFGFIMLNALWGQEFKEIKFHFTFILYISDSNKYYIILVKNNYNYVIFYFVTELSERSRMKLWAQEKGHYKISVKEYFSTVL